LRDFFIRYGILSKNDLARITSISEKSKLDMTEVIASENYLSEEDIRRHYRAQIQEALHEILSWKQCSYKFIPSEEIIKGLKIWGEFKIEGILMESMRRIDELPGIREEFPTSSMVVYRKVRTPPDSLSGGELALFELLEEERAIEYLVSRAKMPEFDTYETLKRLKDKDLIDTKSDLSWQADESAAEPTVETASPRSFKRSLSAAVVFILFSLSMFSAAKTSIGYFKQPVFQLQNSLYDEAVARSQLKEKLHWIIESYRVEYGTYPAQLSTLLESQFVSEPFMEKVRSFSFRYRLTPDHDAYTLL
jgi:hypothetical protein